MNRAQQEVELTGVVCVDAESDKSNDARVPALLEAQALVASRAHFLIGTVDPRPIADRLLKGGVSLDRIRALELLEIRQPSRCELEGQRIAVVGAGITGIHVCRLLHKRCEIVAVADNFPDGRDPVQGLPVTHPSQLADVAFDSVVICSSAWPTIAAQLLEMDIPEAKIFRFAKWMLPREPGSGLSAKRFFRRLVRGRA
ncbi:MAG: hypothetical protein ACFB20_04415 [Opitutales bacterium]